MPEPWRISALKGLKCGKYTRKANQMKIPVTQLHYNSEGVALFNKIYFEIKKKAKYYTPIIRTKSGGISTNKPPLSALRQWDFRRSGVFMEITIINNDGCWRIQMSAGKTSKDIGETPILSGRRAFFMFDAILKKFNIDLKDYEEPDGEIINATIEKPLILMRHERITKDKIFEGVHHVDFHNSYPAGLVNTHPEFKECVTHLFKHRKTRPEYKDLLNYSIGFFHSKYTKYAYARLAKDAIADSNKRVLLLAHRVEQAGGRILIFNTDGFWYKGEIFHGAGEGEELGQWHNDHINCRFRAKSAGAYEYIENGEYHPVIRGYTKLDEIKNRGDWSWGDIYLDNAVVKQYDFDEEKGIYEK